MSTPLHINPFLSSSIFLEARRVGAHLCSLVNNNQVKCVILWKLEERAVQSARVRAQHYLHGQLSAVGSVAELPLMVMRGL